MEQFLLKTFTFLGVLFSTIIYAQIPAADFVLEVNKSISAGDTGINMFEFNTPGATSIKVYDDAAGSNLLATFNPMGANEYTIDLSGVAPTTVFIAYEGPLTQATISANAEADAEKIINIIQWGTSNTYTRLSFEGSTNLIDIDSGAGTPNFGSASLNSTFRFCPNFTNANNNLDSWTTTTVTDISNMFNGASSFEGNLSGWATSNVTSMANMFRDAGNFSNDGAAMSWDVGNVTAFSGMFFNAVMFNADISMWNIGTTNGPVLMNNMFRNLPNFNQDISNWDVDAVTDFSSMFLQATSFNADISGWQTGSATSMGSMFRLTNAFNRDLSSWDVSNVTNMASMFNGASAFTNGNDNALNTGTGRTGINGWDVSSVTSFSNMFQNTPVFNRAIGDWQIRNDGAAITPVNMNSMFNNAAMFDQDLSAWTMSSVTNVGGMFRSAVKFNNDNTTNGIDDWDVSNVYRFASMFQNATIFNQNISSWDVSSGEEFEHMFRSASMFNQDLSLWDMRNATNVESMFSIATSFNNGDNTLVNPNSGRVGLNGWEIGATSASPPTNYDNMFDGATIFNRNLDDWDVSNVTTMEAMFFNALAYNQAMSGWNPINVTNFVNFLDNSGLSQATYDQLLISWADKNLQDNQVMGVSNLDYCIGLAARQRLENEQMITFSGDDRQCSPGAYADNTIFWQSTSSISGVTNGTPITNWLDLSSGNHDFSATSGPTYNTTDAINFNPVLDFDGADDFMQVDLFPATSTFDRIENTTFFVLYKQPSGVARASDQAFLSFNYDNGGSDFYTHFAPLDGAGNLYRLAAEESALTNENRLLIPTDPNYVDPANLSFDTFNAMSPTVNHTLGDATIAQFTRLRGSAATNSGTGAGSTVFFENGLQLGIVPIVNTDDGEFVRTSNTFLGSSDGSSDFFNGSIAEIIAFRAQPNGFNRRAIHTYFAIKYSVEMSTDYYASHDNTIEVWSQSTNTGFTNNVFGLARDDDGALNQKVSTANPSNTDAILTLATSDDFTSLNDDGMRPSFTDNQTYVMVGNNAETSLVWSSTNAPTDIEILNRVWQTQVTVGGVAGAVSDPIYMQFNVDDPELDIPEIPESYSLFVIVDDEGDGDFSDDVPVLLTNTSGSLWSGAVNLANGNRFTLAIGNLIRPGGVIEDIALWLRADEGTTNSSVDITIGIIDAWADQSGNNFNVTAPDQQPFVLTNTINFNSAVNFNNLNQYLEYELAAEKITNNSVYIVTSTTAPSTIFSSADDVAGGDSPGTRTFQIDRNNGGNAYQFNQNPDVSFGFNTDNEPVILTSTIGGTIGAASIANTYANGGFANMGTLETDGGRRFLDYRIARNRNNTQFTIGNIAEVIVYDDEHSTTTRNRIESYLALKYGITLDQSTEQNYTASDGSTLMWDATGTNTSGYNNDIIGIGRDDGSALDQRVSKSINTTAVLTVALDINFSAANDDPIRSTTHSENLQFLSFAHNSGSLSSQNTELPNGQNNVNARIGREWQIQKTANWAQDVFLRFDGFDETWTAYISDNADFSSGSIINLGNLSATGELNLTNANLVDGSFITLARVEIGPGGVFSALTVWFKSDKDVFAAATPASNGNTVDLWENQISVALPNISAPLSNNEPIWNNPAVVADFNFNPELVFDGSDDLLRTFGVQSTSLFNTTDNTVFFVRSHPTYSGVNVIGGWEQSSGSPRERAGYFESDANNHEIVFFPNANSSTTVATDLSNSTNISRMQSRSNRRALHIDGQELTVNTSSYTGLSAVSGTFGFGNNPNSIVNLPAAFSAGEYIVFSRELSAPESQQVESYLALKFGITLDQSTEQSYTASDGATLMWNATGTGASGYNNDIIGLGRDDDAALDQRVSKSVNSTAILTVALDNDFTAANNDTGVRTTAHTNNLQFLSFASDLGALASQTTELLNGQNIIERIGREWQINKTANWEETVHFQFNGFDTDWVLFASDDPDFSTGNITNLGTLDANGRVSVSSFNIVDGQYLTLAVLERSPGGEVGFLNAWFRADKGTLDMAGMPETDNTDKIYTWETQSGGNTLNFIVQNATNDVNTPLPPAYNEHYLNFNPGIDFNGNNVALINNANNAITGADDFVIYGVTLRDNSSSDVFYGQGTANPSNNNTTNRVVLAQNTNASGFRGGLTLTNVSAGDSEDGIFRYVVDEDDMAATMLFNEKAFNGEVLQSELRTVASNRTTLASPSHAIGATINTGSGINSNIAELIFYAGNISTFPNHNRVESYLAVKYGLTLHQGALNDPGQNYESSDGTVIFTAPTNTATAFNKNIFGIGRDEDSCLEQRISRSVNTAELIASTDANFTDINTAHAPIANNLSFVMHASNDDGVLGFTAGAGTIALNTGINLPYTDMSSKVWRVQETNTVDCVNYQIDLTGLVNAGESAYVVISADPTLATNAQAKRLDTSSGTASFAVDWDSNSVTYMGVVLVDDTALGTDTASAGQSDVVVSTIPNNHLPSAAEAYLELRANAKGMVITRVSGTSAIPAAQVVRGMIIYDTTDDTFKVNTDGGTTWRTLGDTSSASRNFCD